MKEVLRNALFASHVTRHTSHVIQTDSPITCASFMLSPYPSHSPLLATGKVSTPNPLTFRRAYDVLIGSFNGSVAVWSLQRMQQLSGWQFAQHAGRNTSHLTPHTSHLTPHTSHLTPHTSHLTPHTSHPTSARARRVLGEGWSCSCKRERRKRCHDEVLLRFSLHVYLLHAVSRSSHVTRHMSHVMSHCDETHM
jgi:hypothetical protein